MTEYFMRHGESQANQLGVIAGQADYPLTLRGLAQARWAGIHLENNAYNLDRIVTSPLTRARETAGMVAVETGARVVVEEDLQEFDMGELTGQPKSAASSPSEIFAAEGAEDPRGFARRIGGVILRYAEPEARTLFVGHTGTYNGLHIMRSLGQEVDLSQPVQDIDNVSIHEIDTESVRVFMGAPAGEYTD